MDDQVKQYFGIIYCGIWYVKWLTLNAGLLICYISDVFCFSRYYKMYR